MNQTFVKPSHWETMTRLANVMSVRARHFLIPLSLSLMAAACDGVAMVLLVPLARGIAANDFSEAWSLPVLDRFAAAFAGWPLLEGATHRGTFALLVGLILFATWLRIGLTYLTSLVSARRDGTYSARARSFTFARILSFGKLYFDRTSQGRISQVVNYSEVVLRLLRIAEQALACSLRLVAHLVVMFLVSWHLSLLVLFIFPVLYLAVQRIVARIRRIADEVTREELELGKQLFNLLACIPLIKTYSQERESRRRYSKFVHRLRSLGVRHTAWSGLTEPAQQTIILSALGGIAILAALSAGSDHTSELSAFCAFLLIARRALPLFSTLNGMRARVASLTPRLDRVAELFSDGNKFFVPSGPKDFCRLERDIELRNLNYGYDDWTPVLRGLSTTLPAGKTTTIVGTTGCGKSTLAGLIARLYDCPADTILLDGADIREFSLPTLARRVAFVSQDTLLYNGTLRSNLTYGLAREINDQELLDVCGKAGLDEVIDGLPDGLEAQLGDRGVSLSAGERQRVAIARALLKEADIVILDEVTANLDTRTERRVMHNLRSSLAGKTLVMITHRLSTIRRSDRIVVLDAGRVVEEGTWSGLLARRGTFFKMWQSQETLPSEATSSAA